MRWLQAAIALTCVSAVAIGGCRPGRSHGDGDGDGDGDIEEIPCDELVDGDGDTIADQHEGGDSADFDLDGVPNSQDDDSDGDGLLDSVEAGDTDLCTVPRDGDADSWADSLDLDADNDGLSDQQETTETGTSATNPDSDGDGFTDLAERAAGTDPNDARSQIPPDDFFVVLPYGGPEQVRQLQFNTDIEIADVFLLVDTTGSMTDTINDVASSLGTVIVPGIRDTIPNTWIGVGRFEDFPVGGYGSTGTHWTGTVPGLPADDVPFLLHSIVRDPAVQMAEITQAVEYLRTTGIGGDEPESHVEAMYQTATGEGIAPWVPPQHCEAGPDFGVPVGYPCFRPGALPIVVIISDSWFHNGPGGTLSYDATYVPGAHTFDAAAAALNAIGARVIGAASAPMSADTTGNMCAIASATGTVDEAGNCLVFETMGPVSVEVVDAIGDLAHSTPQDVSTAREDVVDAAEYLAAGEPEVDATGFIKAVTPVEAAPPDGLLGGMNETTFLGVIPGTDVVFEVHFVNDFVPPRASSRIYQATIVVIGNGVARLDERHVYIVVPPEGQEILI
jgi:hypothetical protein